MMSLARLLFVATLCGGCAQEREVLRGELSWTDAHFARVSECATGRDYVFGVMASVPYDFLRRKYEELSDGGKKPVLVEVEGSIDAPTSTSGKNPTLREPQVIALSEGACSPAR